MPSTPLPRDVAPSPPAPAITIRSSLKGSLRAAYGAIGGPALLRRWNRHGIRILAYHHFHETTASSLEGQCRYIRRHYNPVSLSEAAAYLRAGRRVPPNLIAVTVDDGYRDFLTVAHPIFSAYTIPTAIFLVSDFVDRKCWLWWDQVAFAFHHTSRGTIEIPSAVGPPIVHPLRTAEDRHAAVATVIQLALRIANANRLRLLDHVLSTLDVTLPAEPPSSAAALSWAEVRFLATKGVEIGSHTKTHPILSRLADPFEIRAELFGSKHHLESEVGRPVVHFCYPNGGDADFDGRTLALLEETGFRTAVTANLGLNVPGDPMLRLKRIFVEPTMPEWLFREWVDGRWRLFRGRHQTGDGL